MRNFTIFKTGSQRGVNTFMSGEGAIEHPMSTHSAPFGTSWKARGWRYIASILMILTLCVGNAWGANSAKVTVNTDNTSSGSTMGCVYVDGKFTISISSYSNKTKSKTISQSGNSNKTDKAFVAFAVPHHGYKFTGWSDITVPSGGKVTAGDKYIGWRPFPYAAASVNYVYAYDMTCLTAGNSTYTYTLAANFAAASTATIKVQKKAGLGRIKATAKYYVLGTGKPVNTIKPDFAEMDVATTSVTLTQIENENPIYEGDELILEATPEEGYRLLGWYEINENGEKSNLVSTGRAVADPSIASNTNYYVSNGADAVHVSENMLTVIVKGNTTYYAEFGPTEDRLNIDNKDYFIVDNSTCQTFEQALAAAKKGSIIRQLQDYTIDGGNYVIPADVTLLIPKDENQTIPKPNMDRLSTGDHASGAYRTLTLTNGAHLDVYGTIEVGCTQSAGVSGAGGEDGIGFPTGTYGCLQMNAGSSITLNNGAHLYAWGYVLGERNSAGEYLCGIDARRGSRVHEQFQLMDWKGGTYTMGMFGGCNSTPGGYQVLPVNQYYIQNVEVPVKYRPGAKLFASGSVNIAMHGVQLMFNIDNAGIIGAKYNDPNVDDDAAIFLMDNEDDSEDTWVRKLYNPVTDQQVYEANNSAYLGSLVMKIQGQLEVNSSEYKLPITNNFKIRMLYGNMEVTQNTELLAGAEIEIEKEAALTIPEDVTLYLWDKDDWGDYVSTTRKGDSTFDFGKGTTVKWRPGGRPTVRRDPNTNEVIINDAKLTLHGSVNIEGYLKTSEHGTSITSTIGDAGTVVFKNNTPADADAGKVWQVRNLPADCEDNKGGFIGVGCTSAKLKNEDGTFTETADTTATKDKPLSFCFIDFDGDGKGEWKALATNGCIVKDENNVYYIKPQEYVAISQGAEPEEEADHTYRDHYAGTNRIFILASGGDCQWWEVRVVPGHPDLFECINENNHTFYYYDESAGNWMEKKFKVEWVNWDGSPVKYKPLEGDSINYYMVTYGTVPTWKSNNPTHVDDASHTYSFNGWLPAPAPVTEDVTYTAQYEERDRMYAITFNDANDELIQVLYCKLGEIPVCTKYDAAANNKVWKTASGEAIGAVAGDETYKLYEKESKDNYTIRFVNWNGDVLQSGSVAAGSIPSAPTNPTKDPDDLHSYSFKEWNPAVVAANADATYTATYNVGSRGYTVLWKKDGVTIETDENVPYGEVPEYNGATPAKAGFTFIGWSPAVAAVTGNATYTAQFMENRTISTAQTLATNTEVSTITVETNGALTINDQVTLTAENLILKGGSNASGQLIPVTNKSKINATNAYYDLTLGAPQARHWNAFGVPWVVNLDLTPLIELNADGEPVGTLALGRDYDIVVYNGATRASQGPGYWCWEFLEHHVHNLTPGKGYMIQFIKDVKGIRFTKVSGTDFFYKGNEGNVHLDENGSTSEYNVNNGWNAMANPMPFHATMTNGPTVGYVHNGGKIGNDGYVKYNLASGKFFVGKTVYVQAGEGGDNVTPVLADGEVGPIVAAAPARRTSATDKKYMALEDYYTVVISDAAGNKGGDICVLPEEEKENKYVIGHDLAQFGMSTAIPQIWVNRYDTKLALNTTALVGETAEFPMGVYAPAAGEYTISLNAQPSEDYTVYLTRDGQVIWNLSDGAFVTTLTSGIQSNYGVRLVRKAPQVATGIDEAVVDAKNETRKVLIDNQVFIIREGHVYTVDGQIVK